MAVGPLWWQGRAVLFEDMDWTRLNMRYLSPTLSEKTERKEENGLTFSYEWYSAEEEWVVCGVESSG
jgi:hypothetical protein